MFATQEGAKKKVVLHYGAGCSVFIGVFLYCYYQDTTGNKG